MKCPYCGTENPDIAIFCGGCGKKMNVDTTPFETDEPVHSEPADIPKPPEPFDFDDTAEAPDSTEGTGYVTAQKSGNRNRNFILAIILIAAAAVVAIFIIFRVTHRASQDEAVVTESVAETAVMEVPEEDELTEDEEEVFTGDVPSEDTMIIEDIEDSESEVIMEDAASEIDVAAGETGSDVLDGAKETVPYSFQMQEATATDQNGNVIVRAFYDLVVLEGEDGVNQKINANLEQDCEDFLSLASMEDEGTIEAYSADDMRFTYETDAIVVYDKHGVLSILYEVWYSNTLSSHGTMSAATYSLENGDRLDISDLTDMSDEELLEEIKTALRISDHAIAYFNGMDETIDSLTMDDIREEFAFIVEGGEIVIVVPSGVLAPEMVGSFKVPTTVYINTMNYDEYTADYIFSDSNTRCLTRDDLYGLSKEELRLARNEIFARHGRLFRDENLDKYFQSKSWYNGTLYEEDFDSDVFNDIEWANLELLNDYDEEMGYQ